MKKQTRSLQWSSRPDWQHLRLRCCLDVGLIEQLINQLVGQFIDHRRE